MVDAIFEIQISRADLEAALQAGDPDALALRARARELIDGWRLAQPPGAGAALMTRSS